MRNLINFSLMTVVAAVFSFGISTSIASAEAAKCGKRDKLVTMLKKRYKEVPVGLGISLKNTEAFEIFVSEKGTWTVTMTMSNGLTCVMAVGHSWQKLPEQLAGSIT
ncbi:MAG: hypothetical protein AAF478_02280 [Pseudomonadota bacterium]